jgi:hypothetical protein
MYTNKKTAKDRVASASLNQDEMIKAEVIDEEGIDESMRADERQRSKRK